MYKIYNHITDMMQEPRIIEIATNTYAISFEWMKICSVIEVVKQLLEDGTIREGDTLIDSSSGVYAYSLVLTCNKYNLKCIVVAASTINNELKLMLELLGATVHIVKAKNLAFSQKERIKYIEEIISKRDDIHWMQQYNNKRHYDGYSIVGKQIFNLFKNKKIILINAIGTGASAKGISSYLKKNYLSVRMVGVEPFGSISFCAQHIQDSTGTSAGIGSSKHFKCVDHTIFDTIHWVSFNMMSHFTIKLYKEHLLFSGLSSGATYAAALWESKKISKDEVCLFVCADQGYRYFDILYKKFKYDKNKIFKPHIINDTKSLKLPWSIMNWNKQINRSSV